MARLKKIKAVIANDLHIPFQDEVAVELFLQFIKKKPPAQIILLGDICDFYQISRFDKDPAREANLQADLDKTSAFLEKCRENYTGEIHYIQGNHERRLRKYLWRQAKALSSLRSLALSKLLNFDSIGIEYHEHGYQLGDLFCTHGSIIRKHAGYTARAEFEKNGCTGISAHSHRDGKYTVRNRKGQFAWWENYCIEPATRILKRDLTWQRLSNCKVGDTIIGIDEFPVGKKRTVRRKFRNTTITGMKTVWLPAFEMKFKDGRVVRCSGDHLWLIAGENNNSWVATKDLSPGRKLKQLGAPWPSPKDYDTGYLAGILDGEGSIEGYHKGRNGIRISCAQTIGEVYDRICKLYRQINIKHHIHIKDNSFNGSIPKKCGTLNVTNIYDVLKILGSVRPIRLFNKLNIDGLGLPGIGMLEIKSIKPIGTTKLVSLQTGTRTFLAEGIISHNCLCDLSPEYIEGVANWAQGFSCVTIIGKRPYLEQIPIINGAYIYGGKLYGGKIHTQK